MHKAPTLSLAKKLWFKTLLSNLLASGYSKTEIAQRIGISPQRLTNLINGSDSVSDKVIDSFSSVFQLGNISIESENSVPTGSVSDSLKEKNMEDFEQKYNELIEAVRAVVEGDLGLCNIDQRLDRLKKLLPEKESDDERVRRMLLDQMKRWNKMAKENGVEQDVKDSDAAIAYLEKQKEQKPAELPKSEDYGIDGLYAAVDILQTTLGKVDGYQTDDGILEHKCAISAVKELYEQQPAEWNEKDEIMLRKCISATFDHGYLKESDWLKSRLHLQPKIE